MNPIIVGRVLKSLAAAAGLSATAVEEIFGRFLRVGAAQQLTIYGRGRGAGPGRESLGGGTSGSVVKPGAVHIVFSSNDR